MKQQYKCVARQGNVYHVTIEGHDYAMFIWRNGKHFAGRIEGHPKAPEQAGTTALAVREALRSWLVTAQPK